MNELMAIYEFTDIDNENITLLSEEKLTNSEWLAKVNEHNIKILNRRCIGYDYTERRMEALKRDV